MTINTGDVQFCPFCKGRLYVAITSPVKWVHVSTDTTACPPHQPVTDWPDIPRGRK